MSTNPPPGPATVHLRLLGPMRLSSGEHQLPLPRSKKSRALLGYLAATNRAHQRQRLCDLFWDSAADDPRGALRWTLSRLRGAFPEGCEPLQADRESVSLCSDVLVIDVGTLGRVAHADLNLVATDELEALAELYQGEFLEGLDLPDFLEFSAWCVAQREELRGTRARIVRTLVSRHDVAGDPERALEFARRGVALDSVEIDAWSDLLRLLIQTGRRTEAERRYRHAHRQLREIDAPDARRLEVVWSELSRRSDASPIEVPAPEPAPSIDVRTAAPLEDAALPFVGRGAHLAKARAVLHRVREQRSRRALLFTAEPGGGKSRLLERLRSEAEHLGFAVLRARAYDLERGRPLGPWIDALRVAGIQLAESVESGGRTRLYETIAELVRHAGSAAAGVALILDDLQWLDRDSADVLQFLMHSYDGPFIVLSGARGGELTDNAPVRVMLRSLSHARALDEIELPPMTQDELQQLIGPGLPVERVLRASAGNPLYAIELTRCAANDDAGPPPTLVELIRERLARLSDAAMDVLRWGAVLGYAFDFSRLNELVELDQAELVDALEQLERHALIKVDAARDRERHAFAHDVVREAVYSELSTVRKRLMHRKVALLLSAQDNDPATAHEVARHASLAREAELGVRACLEAGKFALRTCANADAEALARRGLHQTGELAEPARVSAALELLHVLYSARAPHREEAAQQVRLLAERALDLGLTRSARVGFQMLSFLRWESSSLADAHTNILQAERVSRSADAEERSQALAHAARCLVLLERNLGQAEAFVMEASGVAERSGKMSAAVAFAIAMIAMHRGEHVPAEAAFCEAQDLARASGQRLAEFGALEHRLMLAVDERRLDTATALAAELVELGARVRPGSEMATARSLYALVAYLAGDTTERDLDVALDELRRVDAKYELSFVLTRAAQHAISSERIDVAERFANDAVEIATAAGRTSENAIAASVLLRLAEQAGQTQRAAELRAGLVPAFEADLSAPARTALADARATASR